MIQLALDPLMFRNRPLRDLPRIAADLDYPYIELSPRKDFLPLFIHPRADRKCIAELKAALIETGVGLASLFTVYRWSSPDEEERQAAVRYWKRAVAVALELDCKVFNSELSGRPEAPQASEAAFWKTLEEILPLFEREDIEVHIEPHPGDFIENGNAAVDLIRAIGSPQVKYLYCAPHTFHMGGEMEAMIRYARLVLAHVHLADTFDHRGSSGLRYIVNPQGSAVRIHQHLNIGEGELDWDLFFRALRSVAFDGIMTSCVFAWEEKAMESSVAMRDKIRAYTGL